MKKIYLLLLTVICLADLAYGQELNAIFSVKVAEVDETNNTGGVRSFGADCSDGSFASEREYTAYVGLEAFNTGSQNTTVYSSGCLTRDCDGACRYGGNTPVATNLNFSSPYFITYLEAWEDDAAPPFGNRCNYDDGDDCHVDRFSTGYTENVYFKDLSSPSNGTYVNTPEYGGNNNHAWTLAVTWKYSSLGTPPVDISCSSQTITYGAGHIRSSYFQLQAGIPYEFETLSGGNTYLRLYSEDGYTLVASNDDGGTGTLSKITYTSSQTGGFFLECSDDLRQVLSQNTILSYKALPPTAPTISLSDNSVCRGTPITVTVPNPGNIFSAGIQFRKAGESL